MNKEKLNQEVEQLRGQNDAWSFFLRNLSPIFIPVAAVAAGAWRLRQDRRNERDKRDEERFQNIVVGLGSETTQSRIVAAIMLRTFLQPEYARFHIRAFDLVVGSLRCVPRDDTSPPMRALRDALTASFKESFSKARDYWKREHPSETFDVRTRPLDATGVPLDGAFFYGVDLAGAFMPEASLAGTDFTEALLTGASLWNASSHGKEVKLRKAHLEKVDLGAADLHVDPERSKPDTVTDLREAHLDCALLYTNLSGANLAGAVLCGAKLVGERGYTANLSRANLAGADLTGADLRGVDLCGAQMDGQTKWTGADFLGAKYNSSTLQLEDEAGKPFSIEPTVWPVDTFGQPIIPAGAVDVCQPATC